MFERRRSRPIAEDPGQAPVLADPWVAPDAPAPIELGGGDPTALLPWIDEPLAFDGASSDTPARRTAPPARVAEAPRPKPTYDPRWTSMALGTIHAAYGPSTVEVPERVMAGLDEAQRRMNRDGQTEHGGNLVRTYGGAFDARHGGEAGGADAHTFTPDRENVGTGQTFVGYYHTHSLEPGQSDDTFSDDDIANFTNDDRRISMVRAGANTHMLVRTQEFEKLMRAAEGANDAKLVERQLAFHNKMKADYDGVFQKVYANDPKNRAAALEAATRAVAQQYHLLYYSGAGAKLSRVTAGPA